LGILDFIFKKEEAEYLPSDGYLAKPPDRHSIVHPGKYKYNSREVEVLGFDEFGHMHATLFLCHAGSGCCTEWGTLAFHMLSKSSDEEIWECTVGTYGMVIHATHYNSELSIKIEVDK
jgi:hypothetical protein